MKRASIAILDVLIWATVLFPLFTGGIWTEVAGKPRGLINHSIGAAICLVFVGILFKCTDTTWMQLRQLTSIRVVDAFWQRWVRWLANKPVQTLVAASTLFAAVYAFAALRRHWAYQSSAGDFGIFVNALWNLAFRGEYVSSFKDGINLFADHQSPIIWLIAPLFRLWPHPELLLIWQSASLAAGGAAAYVIVRQYARDSIYFCALVPLVYWLYPSLRSANLFDFHPETAMLACFLWAIAGLQSCRRDLRIVGAVSLVLALAGKESGGAVLVGICLAWLLGAGPQASQAFTKRLALGLLPVGLLHFVFCTKYVPLLVGAQSYAYDELYRHLGSTRTEILLSPFTRPQVFFPHIFALSRLKFLLHLLAPLAFLPLLSPRHYISFVIPLLMIFMPIDDHRVGTSYHYGIEPAVGMFWALGLGYLNAQNLLQKFVFWWRGWLWSVPKTQVACCLVLVACTLLVSGPSDIYRAHYWRPTAHHQWIEREVLPRLRPEVSFAAPTNIAAHIAARPWAHWLPSIHRPGGIMVDCVITDIGEKPWPMHANQAAHFASTDIPAHYREILGCGPLKIWQHPTAKASCITADPSVFNCPEPLMR